jgi:hypothetical protein
VPAERLAEGLARPTVANPELKRIVDYTYRTTATVGTGSTADMIREEVSLGEEVPTHLMKGLEVINSLNGWMARNANASGTI